VVAAGGTVRLRWGGVLSCVELCKAPYNLARVPGLRVAQTLTQRARVLVVDDEPVIRDLLQDLLVDAGCVVACASNGLVALEILDDWQPDVILLDLMMPVMDGFTFARACRSAHPRSVASILVMSAATDVVAAASGLGVDGWIQKPFDVEQIVELIGRHALPTT
jgi:CheY-like chemotaxis protein